MAFYWGNPLNWLLSYRHITAFVWDTTNKKRKQWVKRQRDRADVPPDFELRRMDLDSEYSLIVLGDTGEGDSSQTVVADKFLKEAADTAFTIIASDVVYPTGRTHDYREKFYIPYRGYKQDIYALPGNHEWYDELIGFMIHFCNNTSHYKDPENKTIKPDKLKELRDVRQNKQYQPNMYFYIDTPHVRIVCIDTGISGRIDNEQEEWLHKISAGPEPKILISGKPIYVNGKYNQRLDNVNTIINQYNYHLVIAGDTHNYQKYRVPIDNSQKVVWHIVNGGGGAYTQRTHIIPEVEKMHLPFQLKEPDDFDCYPSRKDSRKYYNSWWKEKAPDWLIDRDRPPYHKSFVKLKIKSTKIRVQIFVIEEFTEYWLDSGPYSEWDITLTDK